SMSRASSIVSVPLTLGVVFRPGTRMGAETCGHYTSVLASVMPPELSYARPRSPTPWPPCLQSIQTPSPGQPLPDSSFWFFPPPLYPTSSPVQPTPTESHRNFRRSHIRPP